MSRDLTPYASLDDEELLQRVYMSKPLLSALEIELAHRLSQALDALNQRPTGVGDVVTQRMVEAERRTRATLALEEMARDAQEMGLYDHTERA